jgi:hypothetical protein
MSKPIPLEEQIVVGQPIKLRQTIELQFQEGMKESLQEKDSGIKLAESTTTKVTGKGSKRKLDVTVEGIHAGMTKNRTFYPGTTLEASVPSWTDPHPKPVLKNHDTYTEPLGRIVQAEYGNSILTAATAVKLKLSITDQDAIDKILDGRYLTLSVGGSANSVVCSICAKDLVKEGFCGHYRGRTYDGKEAHWIIKQYTGDEISFVNMPADVYSQVIAAELHTDEGGKNVDKTKKPTESQEDLDEVDAVLNNSTEPQGDGEDDPSKQTESQDNGEGKDDPEKPTESAEGEEEDPSQQAESEEGGEETLEEKVARLERELAEANQTIADKDAEIARLQVENTDLAGQLSEANQAKEEAEANLAEAEQEKAQLLEQNTRFAMRIRKGLAERVADLRIMQGKAKPEEREALIEEHSKSTVKVLESTITDLLSSGQRFIAKVTSPGYAVADNNSVDDDDQTFTESAGGKQKKSTVTLGDLEESMIASMTRFS